MQTINDLTATLFEQLERLNDPDLTEDKLRIETERTRVMADLACRITEGWALALKARQAADTAISGAFALPMLLED